MSDDAPYHAHIYYTAESREVALELHRQLCERRDPGHAPVPLFVGELRDHKVGPHRIPQFEIHYRKRDLPALLPLLESAGLTVLVHPLTYDDLADHTRLGKWIGTPLDLDLTTLDPPGVNQGFARFGVSDF